MNSFPTTSSAAAEPVDIWFTICPVASAAGVAAARETLDAEMFDAAVTLTNLRTHADRAVRERHYDHGQPNSFREGGNIPPIWARSRGQKIAVLGLSWLRHFDQIVTLPESDIETVADLKGRRIGLVTRVNDQMDWVRAEDLHAFDDALTAAGLSLDDVEVVDVPIAEQLVANAPVASSLSRSAFDAAKMQRNKGHRLRALLDGRVDAIHLQTSDVNLKWLISAKTLVDFAADLPADRQIRGATPIVLTVRSELLETHRDLVVTYVAELVRAARWAKANSAEAVRYIARDASISEEVVGHAYSDDVARELELVDDARLVEALGRQKDWMLRHGVIENDFDVDSWVDFGPLREAKARVDAEESA